MDRASRSGERSAPSKECGRPDQPQCTEEWRKRFSAALSSRELNDKTFGKRDGRAVGEDGFSQVFRRKSVRPGKRMTLPPTQTGSKRIGRFRRNG